MFLGGIEDLQLYQKRDSDTDVFEHILKNMCERLLFSKMQRWYDLKKRFDHKIELKTYFISFFLFRRL